MLLHATMPGIISFLKEKFPDSNLKDDEYQLLAYLLVAKQYDLDLDENQSDTDIFWFLRNDSALTATATYQYSVQLEYFYMELCRTLILQTPNFSKNSISSIAVCLFIKMRKIIYKIKDDEKCVYIYICQNDEGVSKNELYKYFKPENDKACYYKDKKNISFKCVYKNVKCCCSITENDVTKAIDSLIENKAISLFEDDKKGECYKCVW